VIRAMTMLLMLTAAAPAQARLLRLEVLEVVSPAFDGRGFGAAGTYDRIAARATVALDPADPHNEGIADLAQAPRNADGKVLTTFRRGDPAAHRSHPRQRRAAV
jgi:hypothetical protein